jgi:bacterioferritin (cytochrome b1)
VRIRKAKRAWGQFMNSRRLDNPHVLKHIKTAPPDRIYLYFKFWQGADIMDNTSIKELNALLKGEHMAIDGYEKYIQRMEDRNIKGELQNIQKQHKQHAIRIAERIQNLGGHPVSDAGVMMKMAAVMADIKDTGKTGTADILEDALSGESNGIRMAREVARGDLDAESKRLIDEILDDDTTHLDKIKNIMSGSGWIQ